jgi:hypothetical protein
MGVPEMEALWRDWVARAEQGGLSGDEARTFRKLVKVVGYLAVNPRHNSLSTHEIDELSRLHGVKIFQSYLENRTPAAGRLFWAYGPNKGEITVLALEPHPEDKKRGAYARIRLSRMAAKPPPPSSPA